jgi:hypothetical protein
MTTIKTNNKLIAEFMGLEVKNQIVFANEKIKTYNERTLHGYNISMASYDSSWDWLMPVIEKISSEESKFDFSIPNSGPSFQAFHKILSNTINVKITDLYLDVIEFIKWYNENVS